MENEKRLYEAAQEWSNGDEEGKAIIAKWSPDNEYSMEALEARNATMERYGYGMMKDGTDYNVAMKALSIHPLYAMSIVTGQKTIECRSWTTSYRGDILICSTAKKEKGTIPGHALGVVTLEDIVPFQRKHLKGAMMNNFSPEDYAWILANPRVIKPFPIKGKQSLWTCEHEIEYLPEPKNEKEDEELGRIYWDPIMYNG